jgi:hypothetical protein
MNLSQLLELYTIKDVYAVVKKMTNIDITQDGEYDINTIVKNFKPLGNNLYNAGSVDQISDGEKGIVERLTNSIDAFV